MQYLLVDEILDEMSETDLSRAQGQPIMFKTASLLPYSHTLTRATREITESGHRSNYQLLERPRDSSKVLVTIHFILSSLSSEKNERRHPSPKEHANSLMHRMQQAPIELVEGLT